MRTAITFDTLQYMDELKKSGMRQEEAEAITKANTRAFAQMLDAHELATKRDLKEMEICLRKDLSDTEMILVKDIKNIETTLIKLIHENMWKTIGILVTFQTIIIGAFAIIQYLIKT